MHLPIVSLTNLFNAEEIMSSMPRHVLTSREFNENQKQLAITHAINDPTFFSGVGSLYSRDTGMITRSSSEFTILNKFFVNTYIENVLLEVSEVAKLDNVTIGRVRLMLLSEKSCYTLHRDSEEFRYHIPLITSRKCFFVVGGIVCRMPEKGRLYRFNTMEEHTAVNASFLPRMHLVFDTF